VDEKEEHWEENSYEREGQRARNLVGEEVHPESKNEPKRRNKFILIRVMTEKSKAPTTILITRPSLACLPSGRQ
jgi:hypothetical protein